MMQSTRPSAAARGSHAVADAAGKIADKVGDLRETAADLARTGAESVSDATVAAQRQLGHYARATRRYVDKQPWQSAVFAAFVGAAALALLVVVFHSPREAG